MTSISVIIPAYNAASTITRALQSVAAQTRSPKEIIVIDDASTDNTREVAANFASTSSIPLRVITQPANGGPSAARNAGWDAATSDYIAFLDADDQWHPRKIELQYPLMHNQPEVTMSCHLHDFSATSTTSWELFDESSITSSEIPFRHFLLRNRCTTPSVILKRSIGERFDSQKRFAEDYLLWMQITATYGPAKRLNAKLVRCSNPAYGGSGQSGQLRGMARSEFQGFRTLRNDREIGVIVFLLVTTWSWIKFGIRLFDSKVMKIRR